MIEIALLQENGNGRMEPEIRSLYEEFKVRQVPVKLFVEKQLFIKKLQLNKNVLVAGYIPVVLNALLQLGIQPPKPNDYPQSLQSFLRRRIWQSTVQDIVRGFSYSYQPISAPIFVLLFLLLVLFINLSLISEL